MKGIYCVLLSLLMVWCASTLAQKTTHRGRVMTIVHPVHDPRMLVDDRADPPSSGGRVFVFDPRHLSWYAYDGGRLVRSGRASGGRGYCPDIGRSCHTPVGRFRVLSKGSYNCKSTRYPVGRGGAPMYYCMFFTRLYAVHGSNEVPDYNASHGCIRVPPSDAAWLSANFMELGTPVVVKPY